MAAKRIRVSDDAGASWHTLPGNTGEIRSEGNELTDTIFGQSFSSAEVGLISGQISAQAFYKGFAGYHCDLRSMSGSSTTFTGEATSTAGEATDVYRIADATKNCWDHTAAVVVLDGVTDVTDEVEWIDFLFGKFKFQGSFTPAGTITVTGKYFTQATVAKGRSFNLTQTMEPIDITDFATAQSNGGRQVYDPGLKTVALEIGNVYAVSNGWRAALEARSLVLIEIAPVGNGGNESRCRGIFKPIRHAHSGDVGNLEEETVNFSLQVIQESAVPTVGFDDDLYYTPFRWSHPSATGLAAAVQKSLTAWESELDISVQYLPDGSTGVSGTCVVSEISLTGGLEAMNEFSITYMISGALATV